MTDDEYYDWECTACGNCVCCATVRNHPDTYINSYGKHSYACKDGYVAKWVTVNAHLRDMEDVRKTFGDK